MCTCQVHKVNIFNKQLSICLQLFKKFKKIPNIYNIAQFNTTLQYNTYTIAAHRRDDRSSAVCAEPSPKQGAGSPDVKCPL